MFNALWIWYMAGAIGTLIWKWQRYCYENKGKGTPFWKASKEWFEITTFCSKVSWVATIGLVWVIGTLYINRIGIDWIWNGVFKDMPVHASFAFLLGALSEMMAPALLKWLCCKIPYLKELE